MTYLPFHRPLLSLPLVFAAACHEWVEVRDCPAGQQEHEDRCLPTPTIVFLRCVEAFRTEKIEHDRSSQLGIDAKASTPAGAPVGGSLSRAKLDRESREYSALPADGIPIAVAECRRQEESERESRLAAALHEAASAQSELRAARAEAATALANIDALEDVASSLREQLEARQTELAEALERIEALGRGVERDVDGASANDSPRCETDACEEADRLAPPVTSVDVDDASTPTR